MVLEDLDLAFGPGRTGLIGRNGTGKSTLLRLIVGELNPTAGTVTKPDEIGYLPQDLGLRSTTTIADLMGIGAVRAALRSIDSGDVTSEALAVVEGRWDLEERCRAALDRLGIRPRSDSRADVLDREVVALSGGEVVLAAIAGLATHVRPVTLLDEPTNNLDLRARRELAGMIDTWPGTLIVISHDRELLEHLDQIVELRDGAARTFGGPFSHYLETIEVEQEAAARMVKAAEAQERTEKRQLAATYTKLDRRRRYAHNDYVNKRRPKSIMKNRKQEAQESAGTLRTSQADKVAQAKSRLEEAEAAVRDDDLITIDLPDTAVPERRVLLDISGNGQRLTLRGPQRIALTGPNGSGKTTLMRLAVGHAPPWPTGLSVITTTPAVGTLTQRLDGLDDTLSVLDNVRRVAPARTPHDIRAALARFLLRGDAVDQTAGTLSGGERFRVSLSCVLLADPAPQLLLLDEPTNSLDLDSVDQLVSALQGYRGGLLVASHDEHFLAAIGVTGTWEAGRDWRISPEVGGGGV